MSNRRTAAIAGLLVLACTGLQAQSAEEEVELGEAARAARTPEIALQHFQAALALDSGNYQAQWRAAEVLMDLGKQTPDSVKSHVRFREKYDLPHPLLADQGHRTADAFGVWVVKTNCSRTRRHESSTAPAALAWASNSQTPSTECPSLRW